jgi:transposase-like protein
MKYKAKVVELVRTGGRSIDAIAKQIDLTEMVMRGGGSGRTIGSPSHPTC